MATKGAFQVLGSTEREVMHVLWQDGRGMVRDVYEQIRKRRKVAYTTIMTTMVRLAEKGVLAKEGTRGGGYTYTPRMTKDELMVKAVEQMLTDLHPTVTERHHVLQALHVARA
jgi:predicted transcriptional regulator